MIETYPIKCPACNSTNCLFGTFEPWDTEFEFSGKFVPLYIKKKTFFTLSVNPRVRLVEKERFYGCYECGHLWSKLNLAEFKSMISKCRWQGGQQIAPKPGKPYFSWCSSLIIGGLLLLIAYLKYNT